MSDFQTTLDQIRAKAHNTSEQGRLFERLIQTYFRKDPLYKIRFSKVWMWSEWVASRADFDGMDTGIDLVAEENGGGYCAVQCKCYAAGTRISKAQIDSFISASAREPFTTRLVIDTGAEWGTTARKTIENLTPACGLLDYGILSNSAFDWPDLDYVQPEDMALRQEPFNLRPHQQSALDDIVKGFLQADRGKLIMACGTGKTFTGLRIAELLAGAGGRVLYLVPSISLFQQTMREWASQQAIPHRYVGICSDTRAGRNDEDASLQELEIPVTTDPDTITAALQQTHSDAMTAVYCTYQSLALVAQAQDAGAPAFDLVLCDEAHRTTGIDQPGDRTSPFVLVHDANRIRSAKRLYMTATPRIYTGAARAKAARRDVEVFSMDDVQTFGPELHCLPFSKAIEQDLLSDYKVVIFTLSEEHAVAALQSHLTAEGGEINLSEAAKLIGCWQALQDPENEELTWRELLADGEPVVTSPAVRPERRIRPLRRAIAFNNRIQTSKNLTKYWPGVIREAIALLPEDEQADALTCETCHVDGKDHALERKARINWLKGSSPGACRILSNARCLSEGIDVPALDAVLFLSERKSQVDVVQAVGRVMRKAEDKEYGYIVLPVTVPAGADPEHVLDDNKRFAVVWSVLRALRSHDDRFDAEINHLDLNKNPTKRIICSGDRDLGPKTEELPFPPLDLPPGAIYAKIVEHCGDRKYWETWARDVADIFTRLVLRINNLLDSDDNETLSEWFADFHDELKGSINKSITHTNAIEMMAQHILTRPVFDALFEHYDFAGGNPVARALDALRKDFGEFGLENETRDLAPFYDSVRQRAQGLDNSEARQRVLMELYEKFFTTAMKKDADRLGIVYTPTEIVDFILFSAEHVLQQEFGRSLSDRGVHVLDPFTGTGIFLVRLLQSRLIQDHDLVRKYREELHANEIVLLAYYIAAIHIEEAFHGRIDADTTYEPFKGIVLTDTFNLYTDRGGFPMDWLPDNSERAQRQQQLPIQVIVGNPPWSVGQKSAADNNPNVSYPEIEKRIALTYAQSSSSANKNSLYDTYKMAIRWASDRIGEQGIIALVTNGSWLDGNADSGVRACLNEEFSSVHVLNLRGNQRTQGERSRREGGKVFGSGSRAPVSITILVRNTDTYEDTCRIFYHDIGDYLSREQKLSHLNEAGSITGIEPWRRITPDQHHDWIGQRSDAFQQFYPMGSKEVKAGRPGDTIFELYSRGYETARDAYVYNFSRDVCADNGLLMTEDYIGALQILEDHPQYTVDDVIQRCASHVRWDSTLKVKLSRCLQTEYDESNIRTVAYRPFIATNCYADYTFSHRPGPGRSIYPDRNSENRAICVPGIGSTKPFSVLMVDTMPDIQLMFNGQCFPRYRYQDSEAHIHQGELSGFEQTAERIDNITDTAVRVFREHYHNQSITADDIFDYIYGLLHAPDYGKTFANDLSKELPRIPFATDFHAFTEAGRALTELHLGYETCKEYPLQVIYTQTGEPRPEHFRITQKTMRFVDKEDRTTLALNDFIHLGEIPPEAHQYEVNGRSPIGWFIDRYYIKEDTESGKTNDPNGWFEDPRDLVTAFRRIVHVSVETVRIVAALPALFDLEVDT